MNTRYINRVCIYVSMFVGQRDELTAKGFSQYFVFAIYRSSAIPPTKQITYLCARRCWLRSVVGWLPLSVGGLAFCSVLIFAYFTLSHCVKPHKINTIVSECMRLLSLSRSLARYSVTHTLS